MRRTSIETYRAIKESGILSQRRMEIYEVIFEYGPMTSAEVFMVLNKNNKARAITSSRTRFTELRDMGAFYEAGERVCNITGRKAIVWDLTGKMPKEYEKPKTNAEIIKDLKEENALLTSEVKELEEALLHMVNEYLEETNEKLHDLPNFVTKWFPDQNEVKESLWKVKKFL